MMLRVSTITATARLGVVVDLDRLYRAVLGRQPLSAVYAKFRGDRQGVHPNTKHREKPPPKRKTFENHVTAVTPDGTNIKIFAFGSVQLTGVKDVDVGRQTVDAIAETLNAIGVCKGHAERESFDIHLINCSYKLCRNVHRAQLHQALHAAFPGIRASFEPCVHPAVRIELYEGHDGVRCLCSDRKNNRCHSCEKTTLLVFSSGSVLIVGAKSFPSVDRAKAFLETFLSTLSALPGAP